LGILISPQSITFITTSSSGLVVDLSTINYIFNPIVGAIAILLYLSFEIYFFFLSYTIYNKARNKEEMKLLIINTVMFFLPILMYILYITFHLTIFRELNLISLWVNIISTCFMLVNNPETLIELTNKIYYINIYHKSGILLHSYKFGTSDNEIESTVWGNILTGINHILSEFVDSKDQIEVLQTDSTDIIVNYDNYGFAVVLISNRKTPVLKKLMDTFALEFREKYKHELTEIQDLNKLINVTEFKETNGIIEKVFHLFL
jgi:hypothetical protein